jgi:hypothetical protein
MPRWVRPALPLLVAWTALDLLFNVRYPAPEPPGWYLLPSLDVTAVLALVALWAQRGRRAPAALIAATAVLVVAVRVFRLGEGVTLRYFNRPLGLAMDLPLTIELVRLLDATVSRWLLVGGTALALLVLAGLALAAARTLRIAEGALAAPAARRVFAVACALVLVGSPFAPGDADGRRTGLFAASALERLGREALFALRLDRYRAEQARRIEATGAALAARPHRLEKLRGAHVLLFLIESYGHTVLEVPEHSRAIDPAYAAAAARLAGAGFTVASGLLDSPTYAGRSWLAHQTLSTGVRTADRVTDELVQQRRPRANLARFFRAAGYRTVFAQPGNRYPNLSRWVYDFDLVYSGWDFGYRGPGYQWATMPDQLVVDFVHRRELVAPRSPLLVAYALTSSHAPWSHLPPFVEDWSRLGDGAVYHTLPIERHDVSWTNLADGAGPYLRAVAYDLRVLADYLARFVTGDALVLVMGDHQPVAEVTRFSRSHAVPVHVISRNRALVAPFLARGYLPGMRPRAPDAGRAPAGMETFLPDLLADFSDDPR